MNIKLKIKKCHKCGKDIGEYEKRVLLKTYDRAHTYEELYFHLNCWIQDVRERDEMRAVELYQKSMKTSVNMLKNIFGNNGKKEQSNESIILQQGSS